MLSQVILFLNDRTTFYNYYAYFLGYIYICFFACEILRFIFFALGFFFPQKTSQCTAAFSSVFFPILVSSY